MSEVRGAARTRVEVVAPGELTEPDIAAWRVLRAASGAPANPFI
ncbi:hypothetical protein ACFXKS_32655 [Streptomyces scopuliridis]